MASVVAAIVEPDLEAIKSHLAVLFAPSVEEYPRGLIELRHGANFSSSYFGIHAKGIEEAAQFAANRAREGSNVYVGVNPRKHTTDLKRGASANDVEIAFFHFADLDDADAVAAAGRRLKALPPTFTVTTGTEPHRRPHFYWKLEEPVRNLGAWTERQRGIAQSLDGDSVIDPPRIMRLAGTVNWPTEDKLRRGYKAELVTLKVAFEDEREPVTPEQVETAFPVRNTPLEASTALANGQTTLAAMRTTVVQDLLNACRSGDQWHNNMIRLVAHLAARGRSTAEILALADHITLPGYSSDQTRAEIATALQGARTKWALPEPEEEDVAAEEAAREEADSIFPLLDLDELETLPPPEWLVHELIVMDGLTVIYGEPGAGKSFIGLDIGLRLALGMDWHGVETRPTGVLYIAGEGARGIGKRVKGWRREHGMEGVDAPFMLLPIPVALLDPIQRAKLLRTIDAAAARCGFKIGLVVIDTVSRALAGAGENGADEMGAFVAVCDSVRLHIGGAVLGVHHSGKDKERGMRGSSVLLGACDGTIRIEKTDHQVTLKTEKQKDAEEAAPIYMEMRKVTWATGLEEEQSTLVPFRSEAPATEKLETGISSHQIYKTFTAIDAGWTSGKPWSIYPQTRSEGRYLPAWMNQEFGLKQSEAASLIGAWQMNGLLVMDTVNTRNGKQGLRVLQWHGEPA
jgi:hypothetical protein